MKRLATTVACILLAISTLSACGSSTDDYCSAIKSTKASIGSIGGSKATNADFDKAIKAIDDITGKAPDSVKKEWKTLGDSLKGVKKALDDAGIKVQDLSDPDKLKSIDPSKLAGVESAAKDMSKVTSAQTKITKEVKDDCTIDLQ